MRGNAVPPRRDDRRAITLFSRGRARNFHVLFKRMSQRELTLKSAGPSGCSTVFSFFTLFLLNERSAFPCRPPRTPAARPVPPAFLYVPPQGRLHFPTAGGTIEGKGSGAAAPHREAFCT